MKLLVLTDAGTHGEYESIYELLRELNRRVECKSIFVVSRHTTENQEWFLRFDSEILYGKYVDEDYYFDQELSWYASKSPLSILEFDYVLLRLDRPLTNRNLFSLSSRLKHTVILNDPRGIVKTSSKEYLLKLPELTPPIGIVESIEQIRELNKQFGIVLKPLEGYGGKGLIKIDNNEIYRETSRINSIDELNQLLTEGKYLWMKYLKNVTKGDKRIIVAGGKVVGAVLKLPANSSWLCNLAQGGSIQTAKVEEKEYEIIESLTPHLDKEGVCIYGLDTLVDDSGERILSEINTLNPGGITQMKKHYSNAFNVVCNEITNSFLNRCNTNPNSL